MTDNAVDSIEAEVQKRPGRSIKLSFGLSESIAGEEFVTERLVELTKKHGQRVKPGIRQVLFAGQPNDSLRRVLNVTIPTAQDNPLHVILSSMDGMDKLINISLYPEKSVGEEWDINSAKGLRAILTLESNIRYVVEPPDGVAPSDYKPLPFDLRLLKPVAEKNRPI